MKPESKMVSEWKTTLKKMGFDVDVLDKNPDSGVPDVTYTIAESVLGFIEFKVGMLPKKDTTKLKLRHWTELQRLFLRNRKNSKTCFMCLRLGDFDYLIPAINVDLIEKGGSNELIRLGLKISRTELLKSTHPFLCAMLKGYY